MSADRGPVTSAVTIIFIVLATVFVAARFFTRTYLVRSVKQDDWWILGAWFLAVGFSASICVGVEYGLGQHLKDISDDHRDNLRRVQYAFSILYNPCIMVTKTSIIVFYLSVMSKDVDPVFKWCNYICLAVVNVAGAALTFLNIFQCHDPISAGYSYPIPTSAKCADIVTLYLSSAPVNISTDLALLFLPMPILTGLRLPKKQKIILLVTFSAGAFVAVVDVVRIAYLQEAALNRLKLVDTGKNDEQRIIDQSDFPWYASLSFMWSAIEVNIGIICACVPSLKPLFLKFLPNFIKDDDDLSPMSSLDAETKQRPLSTFDNNTDVLTNPAAFRRPHISEYSGDDDGDYMGFLNMLSGPDDEVPGSPRSTNRHSQLTRTNTVTTQASDFDFVRMDKSRNMLKLNNRQSLWPVAVVTFIFFLWGFAYGLLDTLNSQFQVVAKLSVHQTLGLHAGYYGGYFIAPLTLGRFVLGRYGFKATMMAGLCVYGCGTLVFWPAAVLTSYTAFVVSNIIVGCGLSCLEIAANPYTALCGPLEYAEVRLNLSQAFQAIGTICSPLLAQRVLFRDVLEAPSLVNTQWAYLAVSLFDFILAIIFYYIPLPEATDDQLEEQAEKRSAVYRTRVGPWRVIWVTLALGVFCQWCYVGAQESNGSNAGTLLTLLRPSRTLKTNDFETIGHTTFAIGRFLGAFLNYMIRPRWILLACFAGCIICSAVQMSAGGAGGATTNLLSYFFEGSIFPIVYAITMRGMGEHTKWAAAFMTSAISGGAVLPVVQWAVKNGHGLQYSYCVILATYCFGSIYPIYLNVIPAARKQVDPVHEDGSKRQRSARLSRARNSSFASHASSTVSKRFGLSGILARRRRHEANAAHLNHVEQSYEPKTPTSHVEGKWEHVSEPSPVRARSMSAHVALPSVHSSRTSNASSSSSNSVAAGSESEPGKAKQAKRAWTEEDDVRSDYHDLLRDL